MVGKKAGNSAKPHAFLQNPAAIRKDPVFLKNKFFLLDNATLNLYIYRLLQILGWIRKMKILSVIEVNFTEKSISSDGTFLIFEN